MTNRTSSGRYWRVAQVLKASSSQDALGMRADNWVDGHTFRCELRNQSTTETPYADGVVVRRSFEIYARYKSVKNAGVSEVDRIEVDGRLLRIQSITNLGNDFIEAQIVAEEIN
jgi:head-tail adaptor